MILPHLGVGGAQRVAVILANHWAEQGIDVHVITTLEHKEDFYELGPRIKRCVLKKPRRLPLSLPEFSAVDPLGAKKSIFARAEAYVARRLAVMAEQHNTRLRSPLAAAAEGSGLVAATIGYINDRRPLPLPQPIKQLATPSALVVRKAYTAFRIVSSLDVRLIAVSSLLTPLWLMRSVGRLCHQTARTTAKVTIGVALRGADDLSRYCIRNQALGRGARPYLRLVRATVWRATALRSLLRQLEPDVVLSFLGATNIITIAAAKGLPTRVVISERNDPAKQQLDEPWQGLRPIIYPAADIVTANSHGAVEQMKAYCAAKKLAYVPNPVIVPADADRGRKKNVLFLARLVHQKAPDVLIEAFARFAAANPDWSLQMAGDGPMDRELMERVCGLGIDNRVVFHGRVKDPTDLLLSSQIFVLPSRFEGTPNSLLEAMASRLACIVTDASPGPLRLVEHGVSGLVVKTEDVDDLAAALDRLARDDALRCRLAVTALERTSIHHLENVTRDWERLLFQ